mmetsp:Transcript_125096/g.365353  ORF Transcript_125096/g.365353 Transcript_125096/m.365353 type:complete len:200 (-) Transcript_125096:330-929(-)
MPRRCTPASKAQSESGILPQRAAQASPQRARKPGMHRQRHSAAVAGGGGLLLHHAIGRERPDYAELRLRGGAGDVQPSPDSCGRAEARGGGEEQLRSTCAVGTLHVRGAANSEPKLVARADLHAVRRRRILDPPPPPQVCPVGTGRRGGCEREGALQPQQPLDPQLIVPAQELPHAPLHIPQALLRQAQLPLLRLLLVV